MSHSSDNLARSLDAYVWTRVYETINLALRTGEVLASAEASIVRAMNDAAVFLEAQTVWRGTIIKQTDLRENVWQHNCFVSTSVERDIAVEFAEFDCGRVGEDERVVLLEMQLVHTRGLVLDDLPGVKRNEGEIVLAPTTVYHVDDYTPGEDYDMARGRIFTLS